MKVFDVFVNGNRLSVIGQPPHTRHCERGVEHSETTCEAIQTGRLVFNWIASVCSDTRSPRNDGCRVGLGTSLLITIGV